MINDGVKEFIENHIDLIENNEWEEVYNSTYYLSFNTIGEFTQTMLEANINPLNYLDYIPDYYLYNSNISGKFVIPNNITNIGEEAFRGCSSLTSITIPDSVTSIGSDAFSNCSELKFLKLSKSLESFTTEDLYYGMGTLELVLPSHITLEEFLELITSMSQAKKFKSSGNYTFVIQGKSYPIKDLYKVVVDRLQKQKEAQSAKIPTLYRIQTQYNYLETTTFDAKQSKMRVKWVNKQAGQAYNCPLFFTSMKDAQNYLDSTIKAGLTPPATPNIYVARLALQDSNFTNIETLYGPALVQAWKDTYINSACIIKKNVF